MFIVFRSKFGEKRERRLRGRQTFWSHENLTAASPPPIFLALNRSSNNRPSAAVFFAGKYVMVMGVIQAASPEPLVRAVKMADLSELAALHRRMWKLEVEDLQQVLA